MSQRRPRTSSPGALGKAAPEVLLKATTVPSKEEEGANWADGGALSVTGLIWAPLICQVLAFITSNTPAAINAANMGVIGLVQNNANTTFTSAGQAFLEAATFSRPSMEAATWLAVFCALALVLDLGLPGKKEKGPTTLTGHTPVYVDNGRLHCIIFSLVFFGTSNFSWTYAIDATGIPQVANCLGYHKLEMMYDIFPEILATLNVAGFAVAFFLMFKGLYFPSTKDAGHTGSILVDFCWGTELYPILLGVDIKRFINCRFSMTFWMLAGFSFAAKSYQLHKEIDYGLLLSAVSQYLYLVKFFLWEIGYMRSIDIIVDRAGWQIQWGCMTWVPAVYTLHTRFLVQHPSGWSLVHAGAIFVISMLGVVFNYIADCQRMDFRENPKMKIWGKDPVYVTAHYAMLENGRQVTKSSLLLASGWWGVARHFHYVFELTAAWSWCFLANPFRNGILPLFYAVFLTILLLQRAKRDEHKCQKKYGKDYDEYSRLVPYLVIPGLY